MTSGPAQSLIQGQTGNSVSRVRPSGIAKPRGIYFLTDRGKGMTSKDTMTSGRCCESLLILSAATVQPSLPEAPPLSVVIHQNQLFDVRNHEIREGTEKLILLDSYSLLTIVVAFRSGPHQSTRGPMKRLPEFPSQVAVKYTQNRHPRRGESTGAHASRLEIVLSSQPFGTQRIMSPSLSIPSRPSRMSLPPSMPTPPETAFLSADQTSWNLTLSSLAATTMQPS